MHLRLLWHFLICSFIVQIAIFWCEATRLAAGRRQADPRISARSAGGRGLRQFRGGNPQNL